MQNLKHKSKFYPFFLVYIIANAYISKKSEELNC